MQILLDGFILLAYLATINYRSFLMFASLILHALLTMKFGEIKMAKRPEKTIKVGKVQINKWVNKGEKFDSVSYQLSKNYKVGEEWKSTNNFSIQELSDVIVACQQALQDRVKVSDNNEGDQSF